MESDHTKIEQYQNIVFDFIREEALFEPKDKVLVAVSGGRDSMSLLHILNTKIDGLGVAHVNYGLRDESDGEESFVRGHCQKNNLSFYGKRVSSDEWDRQADNTQAAARSIRYDFFEEILREHSYQYIATAHHLTDALETMLFHSLRGTGLKGVRGIPIIRGNIVRPLLCLSRNQIDEYVEGTALSYREDQSNKQLKYKRNEIRNLLLPKLKELFPNWEKGYRQTYTHLNESVKIFEQGLSDLKEKAVARTDNGWILDKVFIKNCIAPTTLLWHILQPYGFHPDQCRQLLERDQSGRMFEAGAYELIEERRGYLLRKTSQTDPPAVLLPERTERIKTPWGTFEVEEAESRVQGNHQISVDQSTLRFPLTVRSRASGDRFQPLGMDGQSKTIKKFMIDEKVSPARKDDVPLLIDQTDRIVWVCGYRMDERFKVTDRTADMLTIRWIPSREGADR